MYPHCFLHKRLKNQISIRTNHNMRHKTVCINILFLIGCLLCVASCSSDSPGEQETGKDVELQFDVVGESRADALADISFNGSQFAVYGDMKFMDNVPITVFDHTAVTYNDGKWKYKDTQYWFPKHEHSFVAIYPAEASGISNADYLNSRLSFTYTLPDDYKSASDLMFATHRRMYDESSSLSTSVQLTFAHMMSRIDFKVKNDKAADFVRVTKIKLKGIDRTGNFTILPAPLSSGSNQTNDYTSSWGNIKNRGTLTANIKVDINEDKEEALFPDNNALFMVPQPDNKGVIFEITYELWDDGKQFAEYTFDAAAPIGGWVAGKYYTYSFTVSEITKEIVLTVSVKNWQSPKPTGIVVPIS